MKAADFVVSVQQVLEAHRNVEQALPMARYMKNRFAFLGIPNPERKALTSSLLRALAPRESLEAARLLWTLPEREHLYVGLDALIRQVRQLGPADLPALRPLIETHSWWDTVDLLASRVVGELVLRHSELKPVMDQWSTEPNLWIRRTAILHQLRHRQHTDQERLFRYALHNASDADFFIRKAIGWALREHAKTHPERVRVFVDAHRAQLSGLTVREALKHF